MSEGVPPGRRAGVVATACTAFGGGRRAVCCQNLHLWGATVGRQSGAGSCAVLDVGGPGRYWKIDQCPQWLGRGLGSHCAGPFTMSIITIALAVTATVLAVLLLHEVARYGVTLILNLARRLPGRVTASQTWTRSEVFRSRLVERFPTLFQFIRTRIDPRQSTGLPLTLMIVAALYLAALFSGLTEDILEAEGTIYVDNLVNIAFAPWRVEPLVSAFLWITALGSTPSIVSAVIIATGFLWSQRRFHTIVQLWVTCLGAIATTSVGKLLIGRHRPEIQLDVTVVTLSFPSGHATAALAVYGFLAYAIARVLPSIRERFEIAYWTAVLILLIGFSRIFLGVHYLTDVIGGFLVGGFWLLIGFTIAEWRGPVKSALPGDRNGPTRQSLSRDDGIR
jgi:membrane-associated phospholipid phosphatase